MIFINFPNYKIFRCDNGRGAGTCIYAKDVLNPILMNIDVPKQGGVEDVWIKVQSKKHPLIIVGCVYSRCFQTGVLAQQKKKGFILGDFKDDLFSKGNKIGKIIIN